jgi:hypothetical protein
MDASKNTLRFARLLREMSLLKPLSDEAVIPASPCESRGVGTLRKQAVQSDSNARCLSPSKQVVDDAWGMAVGHSSRYQHGGKGQRRITQYYWDE